VEYRNLRIELKLSEADIQQAVFPLLAVVFGCKSSNSIARAALSVLQSNGAFFELIVEQVGQMLSTQMVRFPLISVTTRQIRFTLLASDLDEAFSEDRADRRASIASKGSPEKSEIIESLEIP
jgi:hypothetical protein